MLYRATFQANGVQTLLLLRDSNKRTSCPVTLAKRHHFPETAFWIGENRDANNT